MTAHSIADHDDCALAEGCMNKELHASDDSLGEDFAYWRLPAVPKFTG